MINKYKLTIGCEVHAQIYSKYKLFSYSLNDAHENIPNKNASYFDIGLPGTMPLLNKFCIQQSICTGLALGGNISPYIEFDRKHYYYPDLSSGFQITQQRFPIVLGGGLELKSGKFISIRQIHMESDAGKITHHRNRSLVDFNRSSVGLMEIVTNPDMNSIDEVIEFLKLLRLTLRYINTCDGNMEDGNFRADINISISSTNELGTRVEIKNLNSFKFIESAILFEVERQKNLLENNHKVHQETRLFNSEESITTSMRSKEDVVDYRYVYEPNIIGVEIKEEYLEDIKKTIPELPKNKLQRYLSLNIEEKIAENIIENKELYNYLDEIIKKCNIDGKLITNWMMGDLRGFLTKQEKNFQDYSKEFFLDFLNLIKDNKISNKTAKYVLNKSIEENILPNDIVSKENLWQINDKNIINEFIKSVIKENKKIVEEYKNGNEKFFNVLIGILLKKTNGKLDGEIAKLHLLKALEV
ncbi:hypothetical protein AB836_02185 [Rickettsiales bacterium (ex Bugula neritina AB1)]|nr:hypothetical protein AB836_02185 [Rickettsiales bacterium (ex Bugula neritina AB1)]